MEARHADPPDGLDSVVAASRRESPLLRDTFGLLAHDVDLDALLVVVLHTSVLANAVLRPVVGKEEAVLGVVARERPDCPGWGQRVARSSREPAWVPPRRFSK